MTIAARRSAAEGPARAMAARARAARARTSVATPLPLAIDGLGTDAASLLAAAATAMVALGALAATVAWWRVARRRRTALRAVTRSAVDCRARIAATSALTAVGCIEIRADDGTIVDADPVAVAWFRLPIDAVLGSRVTALLPGFPASPPLDAVFECRVEHPRDRCHRTLAAVRYATPRAAHACVVFAERTADREVDRMLEALHVGETARLAIAGQIHELNNVFTGLHGYAELLEGEVAAEIEPLRGAIDRGWRVMGDLRRVARRPIAAVGAPERFDDLLVRAVDVARRLVPPRIRIEFEPGAGNLVADLDDERLTTVVLALVRNARDAQPGVGRIRIASLPASGSGGRIDDASAARAVRLEVHDDGDGMSPEVAARACELGFSTRGARGVGLTAVQNVVEAVDGRLRIDTEPGQGTIVSLAIPLAATDEPGFDVPQRIAADRVLVVDDDPLVRAIACRVLRAAGYEVTEAESGTAALRELAIRPAAVLLTDVVMPDVDGGSVARRAGAAGMIGRAIYMTGHASVVLGRHRLPAGAALLRKPFTEDELLDAVRTGPRCEALGAARGD